MSSPAVHDARVSIDRMSDWIVRMNDILLWFCQVSIGIDRFINRLTAAGMPQAPSATISPTKNPKLFLKCEKEFEIAKSIERNRNRN